GFRRRTALRQWDRVDARRGPRSLGYRECDRRRARGDCRGRPGGPERYESGGHGRSCPRIPRRDSPQVQPVGSHMSYQVRMLARARQDFEDGFAWIAARSQKGAERWAASFEAAVATLERNPFVAPIAHEREELQEEVRNIMFRTRAGRTFRALFVVVGS